MSQLLPVVAVDGNATASSILFKNYIAGLAVLITSFVGLLPWWFVLCAYLLLALHVVASRQLQKQVMQIHQALEPTTSNLQTPLPKQLLPKTQNIRLMLVVFVLACLGIFAQYRTFLGVDAGVAFLWACALGKSCELKTKRDYQVFSLYLFFVCPMVFLYDQNIISALRVLMSIVALFYALSCFQQSHNYTEKNLKIIHTKSALNTKQQFKLGFTQAKTTLKPIALQLAFATPLLLLLFLFFPRLPPLWSMPNRNAQASTGVSDTMSPGDVASLSQSPDLAFNVLFKNAAIPPRNQLYWRGLTLDYYDGKTWRANPQIQNIQTPTGTNNFPNWVTSIQLKSNKPLEYSVTMQPTYQKWLFTLDFPWSQSTDLQLTRSFNLQTTNQIDSVTQYNLQQFDVAEKDSNSPTQFLNIWLQLPPAQNPKSQQLAQQLFAQVKQNPQAYINLILKWIHNGNFRYTLSPPKLSGNRIDQFLFGTKQGFCEHYSSAFVYLMRAAHIPARVVTGYQGGLANTATNTWDVRQMDAHAWAEVWLPNQGWVRVDPTAAIAPQRIEQGMDALTAQPNAIFGDGVAGSLRYQRLSMLKQMIKVKNNMDAWWQRNVVGFNDENQDGFLQKWFGISGFTSQIRVIVFGFTLFIAAIVAWVWWRMQPNIHPADKALQPLLRISKKQDMPYHTSMAVGDWLYSVGVTKKIPQTLVENTDKVYQQLRYAPLNAAQKKMLVKKLQLLVNQMLPYF